MQLSIQNVTTHVSARVKSMYFHPTEPLLVGGAFDGTLTVFNTETGEVVASTKVSDKPVRCAKFVPAKSWIVCGSDDCKVRVLNADSLAVEHEFVAHEDYLRSVDVHPTEPWIVTSADDKTAKVWRWEPAWEMVKEITHDHYVMRAVFCPSNPDVVLTCGLDKVIKETSVSGKEALQLGGENDDKGINDVAYFQDASGVKILSGGDDHAVKIWNKESQQCVAVMEGHTNNISCVAKHPQLPVVISGAEDKSARVWSSDTGAALGTIPLDQAMGRVWSVDVSPTGLVAFGCDGGMHMVQVTAQ